MSADEPKWLLNSSAKRGTKYIIDADRANDLDREFMQQEDMLRVLSTLVGTQQALIEQQQGFIAELLQAQRAQAGALERIADAVAP